MKLIYSFGYAFYGIYKAFRQERNMKIHVFVMSLVVLAGILFHISYLEWLLCFLCFGMVIAGEMFNTAIETVVNIASPEYSEKAKLAKDVSAGGVLVLAIFAAIIGMFIFWPKLMLLF